jgi:predicted porin
MFKRQTITIAAGAMLAAFVPSAQAQQSGVNLFGVIDTGIQYVSHAGPGGSSGVTQVSTGNTAASRWGMRGTESLGTGLSAIFALDGGFNSDTGTSAQGGRLFGRQAWVGLQGDWGALTLGRQNNTLLDLFVPLEPTRYSTYGLLPHDVQFFNRVDNSVKYTGNFANLTITGLYSAGYDSTIANGSEVPGAPRIGQEFSVGSSYTIGKLGMAAAYDQRRGVSAATQGNVERRYVGALLWTDGPFTAQAGYRFLQGSTGAPAVRSNLYWLGASYNFTPAWVVRAGLYRTDIRNSPNDAMSYALTTEYSLSKRSTLFLNTSYMNNKGTSALGVVIGGTGYAGVNQSGVVAGVRHIF